MTPFADLSNGSELLGYTVEELSDRIAARSPASGGGAVAAVTVALAAGLVAMAARYSERRIEDWQEVAEQADKARRRVLRLGDRDAAAYRAVLDAYTLPAENDAGGRQRQIRTALREATHVPLEIAEIGAEVAGLGARMREAGNPNLTGDAITATLLAEAAVHSAVSLVRINADLGQLDDDLVVRADRCAAEASAVAGVPRTAAYGRS